VPELYDLVLIGIDAKVSDRAANINSIAKVLGMDIAKIEDIVVNNQKATVKRGLQLHDAQQYQKQIFRHGGFCNYRLSSIGGTEFELIPIEEKNEETVFTCPACDYHEKVAAIEQLPVTCPKCGISPSKYQKEAELKAEREQMKKRLLSGQKLLEQQAKELAERQEKAARQKKLEEEIRKELGLPNLLNSRLRIFGSVALVWILGIGIGIIGVNSLQTDTQATAQHPSLTGGIDASKVNLSLSPQQQTLRQIGALSQFAASSTDEETDPMLNAVDLMSEGVGGGRGRGINPFLVLQAASALAANIASPPNGQLQQAQVDANRVEVIQPQPFGEAGVRAKTPAEKIINSSGFSDSSAPDSTVSASIAAPPLKKKEVNSSALSKNSTTTAKQSTAGQAGGNSVSSQAAGNSTLPVNVQPNPALANAWRLAAAQSTKFQAQDSTVPLVQAQLTPELNGKDLLQESHLDREWGLFLASEAEHQARLKQPLKALQQVDAISLDDLKLTTLGRLSGYYLASNDKPEFERVNNLAMARINGFADPSKQADSLGQWSAALWRIDEKAKSQQSLEAAVKLVASIVNVAEKAKGLASLALHQAEEGQLKLAQTNFQQANQLIPSIDGPATQLRTYVHLAICYAQSGGKDVAKTILVKILGNVSRINDETVRPDLLGEIAIAFAEIGEVEYALATLDKLDSQKKEKMLFNVTRELAYTNRTIDALKGLDKLTTPVNRSRAAALLSLMFHYSPGLSVLSTSLQEKANESQGQISSPQMQAVVRGEMSLYLAHAGLDREAEEWAVKALESAAKINNAQDHDIAFALLAVNFARAGQFALASDGVARIKDTEIAEVAAKEINGIKPLFSG